VVAILSNHSSQCKRARVLFLTSDLLLAGWLPWCSLLQDEERLVFSHRRASSDAEMQNFRIGDVVTGVVQSVKVYGAFLDIGGAMGLLHISQITHERLTTVEQVLQVRPQRMHTAESAHMQHAGVQVD